MSGVDCGGSNGAESDGAIDVTLLEKRLEGLRDTQESVQGLSLWCQANKKSSSAVIDTWFKVLKKSPVEKRLTLFYLANDVVQHAKRKGDLVVVNLWICAVQKATPLVRTPSAVSSAIARIFKIWEERNVYSKDFVADLLSLLNNVPAKDKVEKRKPETYTADAAKVQAFQPSFLVNKVKASRIKSHLGVAFKSKHYFNIDTQALKGSINNREHGLEVISDITKLLGETQESENKLQSEVDERRKIVEAAEIAIVFYENVRSEAKIVDSAYKNFTSRVQKTLEKVNDKIKDFDEMEGDFSPVPSPPPSEEITPLEPPPIPSYAQLPVAPRPPSPQQIQMPSMPSILGQQMTPQAQQNSWQENYHAFNQQAGSLYQTPDQQNPFLQSPSSSNVYQTQDQLPFQLPNFQSPALQTPEIRLPNSFDMSDVSSIPLPPGGPPPGPPDHTSSHSPNMNPNQQLNDYEQIPSHQQMNMNNNNITNNINSQHPPPPNMSQNMNSPPFPPMMNQPSGFGDYGEFMGNKAGRFNPYPQFSPQPQHQQQHQPQQNEHQNHGGFRGNGRRPNRGRGTNRGGGGPRQRGFTPRNPMGMNMNRARPLLDTPMVGGQSHVQQNHHNFPSQPFNNYETFEGKQLAQDVPGVNGGSASPEDYDYLSDGPPGVMSPPRQRGGRGGGGMGNNFRSPFRGRFPRASPRTRGGNF